MKQAIRRNEIMSHLNSKEEPKTQNQQELTELSDKQLEEAAGGELCTVDAVPAATLHPVDRTDEDLITLHSTGDAYRPSDGKVYLRNSNTPG
jgi:hypothetical protein